MFSRPPLSMSHSPERLRTVKELALNEIGESESPQGSSARERPKAPTNSSKTLTPRGTKKKLEGLSGSGSKAKSPREGHIKKSTGKMKTGKKEVYLAMVADLQKVEERRKKKVQWVHAHYPF